MIHVRQALKKILRQIPSSKLEFVSLSQSLGSIIAEDVYSDIDLPPFDKSAMDGYAVRIYDLKKVPVELGISEIITAGNLPTCLVKAGKTAKIMTGAPVPRGADAVVMIEHTQAGSRKNFVRFLKKVSKGANICYRGEDLKQGEKVITKETFIRPQEIGILAAVGKSRVKTYRKPHVAILTTGDELVGVESHPRGAQIRNSNSYAIIAQLIRMGLNYSRDIINLGVVSDKINTLVDKIEAGLKSDILIITGGVSVGQYDLVKDVLEKLKVKMFFQKVAIKPGKPFVFGKKGRCVIFGLPGNPVSCFVLTEVFVRPTIAHLVHNRGLANPFASATISTSYPKSSDREQYLPAYTRTIAPGKYLSDLVEWHGSADLVSLRQANSLIVVPAHSRPLKRNDKVTVMLLDAK